MSKYRGDSTKIKRRRRAPLSAFLVNVADGIDKEARREIAQLCLEDFKSDRLSRQGWDAMHADWVAVYNQQDTPVNRPWEGSSTESLGILTEACNSFQARAYKAFFPSRMPVAAIPVGPQSEDSSDRAKRVAQYLQWSLFVKEQSYKEDKAAMLLRVAVHGSDFTKTYFDPVMNRIVVRSVRAEDLYVPYAVGPVSIDEVPRKTELIHLALNEGRIRASEGYFLVAPDPMQIGQYRSPIQEQNDQDTGVVQVNAESDDYAQIIEQHRDLDLDGDGIAEPYKVWVDLTSEELLRIEVRYEVDNTGRPTNGRMPIEEYTHYRFLVNPDGFYGFGLGFLLGNTNIAINKLLRQFIDATTLSIAGNMSGFISESLNINTGPIKIELGSFKSVSASTDDIQKGIKTLSFPAPPPTVMQAMTALEARAQRIGATTDAVSGDVTKVLQPSTVSQLIDQALTVFTSVQEFLLNSWSRELNKIYRLNGLYFRGYEAFVTLTPDGAQASEVTADDFLQDMMIMPVADPRLASQQSRIQKAQFLFDFATKNPLIATNQDALLRISRRLLEEMEIDSIDGLLPRSVEELPPPPPDPKAMAEQQKAQVEAAKLQFEQQKAQQEMMLEQQKQQVQTQIEQARIAGDQQLQQMRIESERMVQEMRLANERAIAQEKMNLERELATMKLQIQAQIDREKIMMDAEVKREAEAAKAQASREQQQAAAQTSENGAKQMAEMMKAVTSAMTGPKEVKITSEPRKVEIVSTPR
jgi:hypothetical protein